MTALGLFVLAPVPTQALVVDFTAIPAGRVSTATYPASGGLALTIFQPDTFGIPLPSTFSSTGKGLCAWAIKGAAKGRCGYQRASLEVEAVPGPVPALGAAAAWRCARRIRQRIGARAKGWELGGIARGPWKLTARR